MQLFDTWSCRHPESTAKYQFHGLRTVFQQPVRRQKSIWQLVARRGKTIGFGWHCSSDRFSARLLFGHVRLARSHFACVALAGFGVNDWLAVGFSLQMRSLR